MVDFTILDALGGAVHERPEGVVDIDPIGDLAVGIDVKTFKNGRAGGVIAKPDHAGVQVSVGSQDGSAGSGAPGVADVGYPPGQIKTLAACHEPRVRTVKHDGVPRLERHGSGECRHSRAVFPRRADAAIVVVIPGRLIHVISGGLNGCSHPQDDGQGQTYKPAHFH